jgi:hypothetical protein
MPTLTALPLSRPCRDGRHVVSPAGGHDPWLVGYCHALPPPLHARTIRGFPKFRIRQLSAAGSYIRILFLCVFCEERSLSLSTVQWTSYQSALITAKRWFADRIPRSLAIVVPCCRRILPVVTHKLLAPPHKLLAPPSYSTVPKHTAMPAAIFRNSDRDR